MLLRDLLRQIIFSLWKHKARTFLAMFGIIWGTLSVILLLALSNGFYEKQMENLAFLKNAIIVGWPGTLSKPYAGMPQGQKVHIDIKDFLNITKNIPGIKNVSPVFHGESDLEYQDKTLKASTQGVDATYEQIQQFEKIPGSRFISPIDIAESHRVVFIDDSVKTTLFGKNEPLGKTILLGHIPFTVIGVASPDQHTAVGWMGNSIYIPYTTYMAITGKKEIHTFFVSPYSVDDVKYIKHDLIAMLARTYHFDPTDDEAIHIPDLESSQLFITWFFRAVELFLGFCGGLTLSVGGLSIANMMFLIVTERTREIGLRMSIGASDRDIMLQFMAETLFLVGLSGLIGFLISSLALTILRHAGLPEWVGMPYISGSTIFITLFILLLVGALSGFFPARRAANLTPVKALAF